MKNGVLKSSLLLVLITIALPAVAQIPTDLELNSLGISVSSPLAIRSAGDGSNRLFVVERAGTIMIYEPGTGLLGTPF
ncbi:MAG: hypothetical protein GY722_01620, partial [bacterium]|nr:hypothetical protein [bacterium]